MPKTSEQSVVASKSVEFISQLRKLANWLEENPELPEPSECKASVCWFGSQDEELHAMLHSLGSFSKEPHDNCIAFTRKFGESVHAEIWQMRDRVCRRVVTGVRQVPETIIPAVPAIEEKVIPAHEEEIVEWDCEPVMAKAGRA